MACYRDPQYLTTNWNKYELNKIHLKRSVIYDLGPPPFRALLLSWARRPLCGMRTKYERELTSKGSPAATKSEPSVRLTPGPFVHYPECNVPLREANAQTKQPNGRQNDSP